MLGEFRWNQVHTKLLKTIILSSLIRLGCFGYTEPILRQDPGEVGKKMSLEMLPISIKNSREQTEGQSRPRSDSTRLRHLGKYYTGRLVTKGFRESKIQEVDNRAEGKVR